MSMLMLMFRNVFKFYLHYFITANRKKAEETQRHLVLVHGWHSLITDTNSSQTQLDTLMFL